ncbi:MAG: hypothetical protein VSS75_016715 [Candidatus Parabeggiatoa sp.]|nr:hypothetical protein [Candidatus Parabeggiatoa sp.]
MNNGIVETHGRRDARPCVSTWHRSAFAPLREIGFRSNPSLR